MLLIGIVAFGVGILAGYVSLRALGWLVLLVCLSVTGSAATIDITMQNGAGQAIMLGYATGGCPGGTGSGISRGTITPGSPGTYTLTYTTPGDASVGLAIYCGGGWSFTCFGASAPSSISFNFTGCSFGSVSNNYYVSGCITNVGNLTARFKVTYSDGVVELSGPIAPGGAWCVSRTNSVPFNYQFEEAYYNSDGSLVESHEGPEHPAWTNSVPSTGGTGSESGGNTAPKNPIGPESGAGSTNNLTGSQYAAGASNIINQLYQGGRETSEGLNQVRSALTNQTATLSGGLSNVAYDVRRSGTNLGSAISNAPGSGYDTNLAGLLSAISNNTAQATNQLGGMGTNFWRGTQSLSGYDVMNPDGRSNAAVAIVSAISNGWGIVFQTNVMPALEAATNFAEPAGGDLLTLSMLRTNTVGAPGAFRLNFRESAFWQNICPWLRLIGTFLMSVFGIQYVRLRVEETAGQMGLAPGGGPAESATTWLTWISSYTVVATVFASLPIILGIATSYIYTRTGGPVVSPVSVAGAATAGIFNDAVLLGVGILTDLFPYAFAMGLLLYLALFDMGVAAFLIGAQRAIRFLSK